MVMGAVEGLQPFLQMVCAQELAAVLPELRSQPAIAPILDDPRFPAFYEQFRQACLDGLPSAEDLAGGAFADDPTADAEPAAAGQAR